MSKAEQVNLSKELATIVTDLDIEESNSALDNSIFKNKEILEKNIEILEEFELSTFLKGVKQKKDTTPVQDFNKTKTIK